MKLGALLERSIVEHCHMQDRSNTKGPRDTEAKVSDDARKRESETKPRAKNPHAVALGELGGRRGGRARADALSPARRKEIARKAAASRWKREMPE